MNIISANTGRIYSFEEKDYKYMNDGWVVPSSFLPEEGVPVLAAIEVTADTYREELKTFCRAGEVFYWHCFKEGNNWYSGLSGSEVTFGKVIAWRPLEEDD